MYVNELINTVVAEIYQYNPIARRMLIWVVRIIETGQFPRELGKQRKKLWKKKGVPYSK